MMNKAPASLSPEAAAWVQAQFAIHHARTSAAAQAKIDAVDQWAQGLFLALRDVLFHLITDQPELGRYLAADWRYPAHQFEAIEAGHQAPTDDANLDVLEARRLLFQVFTQIGFMPKPNS